MCKKNIKKDIVDKHGEEKVLTTSLNTTNEKIGI